MKFLFVFLYCLITFRSGAQNFSWAKQFGGGFDCQGVDVKTDAAGNVYTTGYLNGTADFDPGPGVYNLGQSSGAGLYISKLDATGNFVWAKQFESWNIKSFAIELDASGNVYTTGFFQQTADFDPGPGVYTLTTPNSIGSHGFISKLDNNGNFVWAKEIGGNGNFYLSIYDQFIDATGNIIATGYFTGTADFDPGSAVLNFTSAGLDDHFVIKLDANGNLLWARQFGGAIFSSGESITADNAGNVYSSGYFQGTVDFDPGPATFNLSSPAFNSPDFFISKLDVNGNFVWAKQVTGASQGTGNSIVINGANIIIAGYFRGTADFDPGPGVFNMTPVGGIDLFLMKLNLDGDFQWSKQIGGPLTDEAKKIALDPSGNIYMAGYFESTVDFDPGPGVMNLVTAGSYDGFAGKFDNNGNLLWVQKIGSANTDISYSIVADVFENAYVTGTFTNTIDFDAGAGVYNMTALGGDDAFVLKLSRCTNGTSSTLNASACNAYTLNGQTYTSSGTYLQTILNAARCDSIITLHLAIGGSAATMSATACDNYTWEGQTYTTSGSYVATYSDVNGCDSIRNLNLVIKNSTATNVSASICEGQSYEGYISSGVYVNTFVAANGCDSVRTLNLIVKPKVVSNLSAVICEGESYAGYSASGIYSDTYVAVNGCDSIRNLQLLVNPKKFTNASASVCEGQTYFAGGKLQSVSGVYKDTLQTFLGCDSIITTNLIVHLKPKPDLGLDINLCAGNSITFNPGTFNSYLWQDLSTSPSFSTNTTGIYWVTVSNNNCSATDSVKINTINSLPSKFLKNTDSICSYDRLSIQPFSNYKGYQWSTGSIQNKIEVQTPGKYWLKVIDANGCIGSDTMTVFQKTCFTGVFIPSGFTPNSDTRNDIFTATVYGNLLSYRLDVYDRAGQLIFRSLNPRYGWNGMYKGVPYSSTVFVWMCSYQLEGEKPGFKKGTVALIR